MADRIIDDAILTDIADAIRSKTGETDLIIPEDMPEKVADCYDVGYADNQVNLDKILMGTITSLTTYATSICAYGLSYRNSLVEIYAPNLKSLGTRAISECNKLVKVDFPSLTSIGTNSMRYNEKLETIILRNNAVCSLASADSIGGKPIIYVPDDLLESYKTANRWSSIADRIKPISELEGDA